MSGSITTMDIQCAKDELDNAIPFHTLLDVSANKFKAELAHKGTLSHRHRPTAEVLRASKMRRSVSTASNFSSITSFHTPDESLEESREATPDSDSGYVVSTVTTTSRVSHLFTEKDNPLPPQQGPNRNFLTELQQLKIGKQDQSSSSSPAAIASGTSAPSPTTTPPISKDILRPPSLKPRKEIQPTMQQPTLADQLKARLDKQRIAIEKSELEAQESQDQADSKNSESKSPIVVVPQNQTIPAKLPLTTPSGTTVPLRPVDEWTVDEVCEWLTSSGFKVHCPRFKEKSVTGSNLLSFETGSGLKDLGIKVKDDREKLKKKLKELKVQNKERKDSMKKDSQKRLSQIISLSLRK